jgi:hypothetical protein
VPWRYHSYGEISLSNFNLATWTRPQQIALVLSIVAGAMLGMAFPIPIQSDVTNSMTYFPALSSVD